jgi:general secretion pathway protein D
MKRVCFCMAICVLAAGLATAANPEAERAFRQGQRLERAGRTLEAFEAYRRAAELEPAEPRYAMSRELARQRAAFPFANAGVRLLDQRRYAEAAQELGRAAEIDPNSDFIKQELARAREAAGVSQPAPGDAGGADPEPVLAPEPPLRLHPRDLRRSWDMRGDVRTIYNAVGAAYGIQFGFDDSVTAMSVRFRVDDADFAEAVRVLTAITNTMVAPLAPRDAIVATDSVQKHALLDRLVLANLPVEGLTDPAEINEVAAMLRSVLEMRYVQPDIRHKVIVVRDTAPRVLAAQAVVESLNAGRPQVLLELQTLQVFKHWQWELGIATNYTTSAFKLSPVNDVVESGSTVPLPQLFGNATPLAGAVAGQPLAAFGAGQSRFGITLPGITLRAALSKSVLRNISFLTVRAGENQPAAFLVGTRYPIVNTQFAPILFSDSVQQQQQAGTLINPFPSFTFEDLGVKVRVTPLRVHDEREVTLRVEAQTRALTGEVVNSVPTISNREADQTVRVFDGQPTIISGIVAQDEQRSFSGAPLLGQVPVLSYLFGDKFTSGSETEIIMVLTPHIVKPPAYTAEGIYLPTNYVPVAPPK